MKKATALRGTKLTERQGLWFGLTAFFGAILLFFAVGASQGVFENIHSFWFAGVMRGYTAIGIVLGILAVLLVLLTFAYSIRKRRRPSGKSATMMTWLWIHVYAGLLAFVLATLHAGPGVVSFEFTSGKVLWFTFAAIVFSGVAWRLVYAFVPPVAGPQVVNYSKAGSARRAAEQETEIEKLAAGKSRELHEAKGLLLAAPRFPHEVQAMLARIPPAEHPIVDEMARIAASRHRALARVKLQEKFTRRLQGWRVLHVPFTIILLGLLVIHVIGALEVPQRVLSPEIAKENTLAAYVPSESCKNCHGAIYAQWQDSMHAHALNSPLTVAQNNMDVRISLKGAPSPDPKRICIHCHSPTSALASTEETLPLPGGAVANEGISCTACHSHTEPAAPGGGGFRSDLLAKLEPGRKYYGPLASPVGNAFHKSDSSPTIFREPEKICGSCHAVSLDRDHDGKIVKGVDLVLQTTFDEHKEYRAAGGTANCVTCHMPVVAGLTRAADTALVPFEQDRDAPAREVHDHSFVGVDYPLDTVQQRDPQAPRREALLRGAATLAFESQPVVEGGKLKFQVALTNTTGHNLPTGFAFARQMWLEIQALAPGGEVLFSSGKLAKASNDLCDASTMEDELKKHVVGCDATDPQLVNIQLKLVDRIAVLPDAKGQASKDERGEYIVVGGKDARETVLQHPEGGPVARKRPATKEALVPLHPLEKRVFSYAVAINKFVARGSGALQVRLMFRNVPPYFVRALGAIQAPDDTVKVAPLVDRLQVVEMASLKGTF
jgi:hypothetical protein